MMFEGDLRHPKAGQIDCPTPASHFTGVKAAPVSAMLKPGADTMPIEVGDAAEEFTATATTAVMITAELGDALLNFVL
jgi:hypothetical protein